MKTSLTSAVALIAGLSLAGSAFAQASGGPDAKGNAPLKPSHTVNDGGPKRGANSFTEAQAMQHIEKSGFTAVSGLTKGDDGVWRGQAMRNGQSVSVAMDFKGNVSTPVAAATSMPSTTTETSEPAMATPMSTSTPPSAAETAAPTMAAPHRLHHHRLRHRRHHHHASCANPSPNGAACSGVDRNHNGISDKEDRAIKNGAHP